MGGAELPPSLKHRPPPPGQSDEGEEGGRTRGGGEGGGGNCDLETTIQEPWRVSSMGKLAVVAVGGNSLIKDKNHQTIPDQYSAGAESLKHIAGMLEAGWGVVVTHG